MGDTRPTVFNNIRATLPATGTENALPNIPEYWALLTPAGTVMAPGGKPCRASISPIDIHRHCGKRKRPPARALLGVNVGLWLKVQCPPPWSGKLPTSAAHVPVADAGSFVVAVAMRAAAVRKLSPTRECKGLVCGPIVWSKIVLSGSCRNSVGHWKGRTSSDACHPTKYKRHRAWGKPQKERLSSTQSAIL